MRAVCPVCGADVALTDPDKRFRTHEVGRAGCRRIALSSKDYCRASGMTQTGARDCATRAINARKAGSK